MHHNDDEREVSRDMRHRRKSARRIQRGPPFLKTVWRSAGLLSCGVVLQASGCMFDGEAFLGDSLSAIYNNVATTLIITTLSDLLGVVPSFAF